MIEHCDKPLRDISFCYMGDAKEVWDERIKLLAPYQVDQKAMDKSGNKNVKFMHCLPAFHDRKTTLGK